jgi:hypothetical protein
MQIWFTILVSCPAPGPPMSAASLAYTSITGFALAKASGSPPHMMPSWPFCAPAWPPDTGASMKPIPFSFALAWTSRATTADAVVWSTRIAPFFMPASAPLSP